MENLRIAFFQLGIEKNNPVANYQKVEDSFNNVEADIFVVPETFNVGFGPDMKAMAEEQNGPTLQFAINMASSKQALFVGTWVVCDGDMMHNRMHIVKPDGSYSYYDKRHPFHLGFEDLAAGNGKGTFSWKGWNIQPAICYDLRFPKWLRNETLDYDLLLVCANWPTSRREAWTTLLKARAIENESYVVGVNRVGKDYVGDSAAIDYKGFPITTCQSGKEEVAIVDLNLSELRDFRERWPFYKDAD